MDTEPIPQIEIKEKPKSKIELMFAEQDRIGLPRTIIHTDIDNTFQMADGTRIDISSGLYDALQKHHIPIHAITGSDFSSVLERIKRGELPYFHIISCKVGTERYILIEQDGKKRYIRDESWNEKMKQTGYDRKNVVLQLQRLIDKPPTGTTEFVFQKPTEEKKFLKDGITEQPFKASCYFLSSDPTKVINEIRKRFPNYRVIICEEINYNRQIQPGQPKKWCLDILPITKGEAVQDIVT
mgnify:CR=1 FL=1